MGCLTPCYRCHRDLAVPQAIVSEPNCNPGMPPTADQLRLPAHLRTPCSASTGSVSRMHIEVGAILLTTHTMLSIHPATCTQRPATTTPNACCMQTEVTLPGSLTFRPVSSGMLKRCQQRSVVHNKARSSRRLCAVQQVCHTVLHHPLRGAWLIP